MRIKNLFLLLLLLALPAVTQAQFTYTTNNGTITITGYTGSGGDVTIPSTISGLSVTAIGDRAFYGCGSLTSVTIPDSVTTIGDYAFAYDMFAFNGLRGVTIPNSVTNIGDYAFAQDWLLTSITIPESVTTIGDSAFENCFNLTSITIPGGVTTIGNGAFESCYGLIAFIVAAQNLHYSSANGVLFNLTQTTLVEYPGGLTGSYTIPGSVTTIGASAFYGTSLTSVTIPNSVTNIGDSAFYGCSHLTTVTIPGSVITIGDNAFSSCQYLTSVAIPSSVTNIGDGAFSDCYQLTAFMVAAQNSHYSSVNGVLFNQTQTTLVQYPGGLTGSYTIPNGTTTIGDYAFSDCYYLTSVTIGNGVTTIGDSAFFNCGLTSVTIPGSVTTIGDYAFFSCVMLTNVYFNGNPPAIGSSVFYSGDWNYAGATVYYLPGTSGWSSTFGGVPAVLWLPPPPQLAIIPSGANVILTWSTNVAGFDYTGFTLQSTTNLADTNSWTTLTNLPARVGSQSQVTDAISGPAKFYRLKK